MCLTLESKGEVPQGCPQGTETTHGWLSQGNVHPEKGGSAQAGTVGRVSRALIYLVQARDDGPGWRAREFRTTATILSMEKWLNGQPGIMDHCRDITRFHVLFWSNLRPDGAGPELQHSKSGEEPPASSSSRTRIIYIVRTMLQKQGPY